MEENGEGFFDEEVGVQDYESEGEGQDVVACADLKEVADRFL